MISAIGQNCYFYAHCSHLSWIKQRQTHTWHCIVTWVHCHIVQSHLVFDKTAYRLCLESPIVTLHFQSHVWHWSHFDLTTTISTTPATTLAFTRVLFWKPSHEKQQTDMSSQNVCFVCMNSPATTNLWVSFRPVKIFGPVCVIGTWPLWLFTFN